LTESFGLGVEYTLGRHFRDFLRWPLLGGRPSYLVALAHAGLGVATVILLLRRAVALWLDRRHLSQRWAGRNSPTAFTLAAALWGFGLLMTLSCFSIHRHYMIVLFPLEFVWVARLALARRHREVSDRQAGRILLGVLWAAQLVISAELLVYIHKTQRIDAEYGTTYHAQQQALRHTSGQEPVRSVAAGEVEPHPPGS
jgi:hypothetical protein